MTFNEKNFIDRVWTNAKICIPNNFNDNNEQTVKNYIYNFYDIYAEKIKNDKQILNEEKELACKIILYYVLNKSICLIQADVSEEETYQILEIIASTVFEIIQNSKDKGLMNKDFFETVENKVEEIYPQTVVKIIKSKKKQEEVIKEKFSDNHIDKKTEIFCYISWIIITFLYIASLILRTR